MWHKFPKHKPPKDGWYQCTIEYGMFPNIHHYVMDLYWYGKRKADGRFIDNRIEDIFRSYVVLPDRMFGSEQIHYDSPCIQGRIDRTNSVRAWKKMPRVYWSRRYKVAMKLREEL